MGKIVIQHHDFESAKEEIKRFSEQSAADMDLIRVDDSKGVGEFLGDWLLGRGIGKNHMVKGEELNELTSQIQAKLYEINNAQYKLTREFGQIYNALEALDKYYIQAILIYIKETEETSEGLKQADKDIKNIIKKQFETLKALEIFKQKLEGYVHLSDIDKIWVDCQKWPQDMASLTREITTATEYGKDNGQKIEALNIALSAAEKKTEDLSAQLSEMIERLESVISFTCALEKITHLQDIDEMWKSLVIAHNSLKDISSTIEMLQEGAAKHQEEINRILVFLEKVSSLEHLTDVDKLWSDVEKQELRLEDIERINEEQTVQLESLSKENEKFAGRLSANDNSIKDLNESITSLKQKIKYAYLIAGGATGLAIIELILILL